MSRSLRLLFFVVFSSLAAGTALAQTAAFTATVTAESADLRDKSTNSGSIVDHVFKGSKLPAFGLSPDKQWVRVKGPAGTAWVSRSQVAVTKGAPKEGGDDSPAATPSTKIAGSSTPKAGKSPAATPSSSSSGSLSGEKKYATVSAPKTNVLLNANDASPTLAVASRNDVFEVGGFSRDKTYVKVRTEDGRIGWIAKGDLKPGRPEKVVAKAAATPKPKATPDEDPDFPPRTPSPTRHASASDTHIWADGGALLFHEKLSSKEGYGYDLNGKGYGGGVRFEHRLSSLFFLEGGYLGTANQRLPAPGTTTTVFSTTHRFDLSAKVKYEFGGNEDGSSVFALAGIQNYTFYVQPQSLDFFYSQIYNGGAIGAGGEFAAGRFHLGGDVRLLVPVLAAERYGAGARGSDGQSSSASGISYGAGVRYSFYSGASLGLNFRDHTYTTTWSGTGLRGVSEGGTTVAKKVTGVKVTDEFNTITLEYARGF